MDTQKNDEQSSEQHKKEQYKKEQQEFNSQNRQNYEPDLKKVEQLKVLDI